MLYTIRLKQILFLDIETVPEVLNFSELSEKMQILWGKKSKYFRKEIQKPEDVYERAGIYAEFGKIICISVGFIIKKKKEKYFRVKSFYGDNETKLLLDFRKLLTEHYNNDDKFLCAHNGKEFDYPYIARRMLINGLKIPKILNSAGKKPWEIRHLDTLELWKFGDYKHYTSLELLTEIFDIPTPKDDIDGSMVSEVYWKENDLKRIIEYCEKDVLAVAQLFLKYRNEELICDEGVISANAKIC